MVDDPRLARAVIPTSMLVGIRDLGQDQGCNVERWLGGTGLRADQLVDPNSKVSWHQATTVLKRALRELPPGPIGMRIGGRDALVSFGMLGMAVRSASTGAEALALGLELHQASGSLMDVEAEFFADEVAIRLRERAPESALVAFLCEEALCSTLLLARAALGDVNPTRIELTYAMPTHIAEYRAFFRCPIQFHAQANRMFLDSRLLEARIATHDPTSHALAVDACRRLLDADGEPEIVRAVESLLGSTLHSPMSMVEVAERLCMTERTLRRQLGHAGERFSDVRDRVRERHATFLLRQSALSVVAIAAEVGFSDPREFRRAYRRWTGHVPTAARTARAC